ncbi:MAG: aminoglycoside phosphotransferase family protein [Anaerolineae bacterium]|nr:aminoglycoside phosphotransferase family protein [Anaerolineae bacterium]
MNINTSLVGRLVASQFPQWAELPIKPVALSGWDNRTFHLGENMLVRLPSAARYREQVEKEQCWLPQLAPRLPLPIPTPLAMGLPAYGYPWHWSIYRWLEGEPAAVERIADLRRFARDLAQFLAALQRIDPAGGPPPGRHNFWRGGPLTTYDADTRRAIAILNDEIDTGAAIAVWKTALKSTWHGSPVWIHGDVAVGNLLVKGGQLCAVIDFGSSGVGDPACDMVIAWTLLKGESREAFRTILQVDDGTWARGLGWALWKALITLVEYRNTNPAKARDARRVIAEVQEDYQ